MNFCMVNILVGAFSNNIPAHYNIVKNKILTNWWWSLSYEYIACVYFEEWYMIDTYAEFAITA